MIGRNLYFQIIFRIVVIVLLSLSAGWMMASGQSLTLILFCFFFVVILIVNLIKYLNSTNRKISYFLDSVQNEDSTLSFPTNITDKPIREIYQGLNKVDNKLFVLLCAIDTRIYLKNGAVLKSHMSRIINTITNNEKNSTLFCNRGNFNTCFCTNQSVSSFNESLKIKYCTNCQSQAGCSWFKNNRAVYHGKF